MLGGEGLSMVVKARAWWSRLEHGGRGSSIRDNSSTLASIYAVYFSIEFDL